MGHKNVRVYGAGRSGTAYADRLREQGYHVTVYDKVDGTVTLVDGVEAGPAIVAILALPRGHDVPDALHAIKVDEVTVVVDLTTQSPESARTNADLWESLGGRSYHAGGSNGGERAVRAGYSYLLVGPRCDPATAQALRDIAHVSEFETLEYATGLKLCHNAMLVVVNEMARFLVSVCQSRGIARQHLEKVIDDGPAGRRFGDLTSIRHLKGGYPSSYVGEYAAKDWRYFLDTLADEEMEQLQFVNAELLEDALAARGREPWA